MGTVALPVDRHKLDRRRSAAKHGRVLFLWREQQVCGGGGGADPYYWDGVRLEPTIGCNHHCGLYFFSSLFFVLQHLPQGVSCLKKN